MNPSKHFQDDPPPHRTEEENQKGKNKRSYDEFTAPNATPLPSHFTPPPLNLGFRPTSPADMNAGQGQSGQFPQLGGLQSGPVAFPPPLPIFSPSTPGPQTTATDEPELAEPGTKRFEREGSASFNPLTSQPMQPDDLAMLREILGYDQADASPSQQPNEEGSHWMQEDGSYPQLNGQGGYLNNLQDEYLNTNWQGDFGNTNWQGNDGNYDWQGNNGNYDWQGNDGNYDWQGWYIGDEEEGKKGPDDQQQDKEPLKEEQEDENEDATKELQVIKFAQLEGVQVLTEKFEYGGKKRRRPVEWKIPFTQWQQSKLAGGSGATPRPMSLYGEPYTKTEKSKTQWVNHDEDFDADKKYQYGHMLPTASGASQHYALTTPMEQRTNQVHGWKEAEGKINRLLLKPGSKDTSATPADEGEENLALLIQRSHSDGKNGRDGFVRIVAHYGDDDKRVPSSYHVRLYGRADGEVHLLYEFEKINNSSDVDRDVKPSAGLIALFATMNERMQVLDKEAAEKAKQGQRHASDTQWTPITPVASSVMGVSRRAPKEAYFPARGIPEQHLPRPHRVLDVLVAELNRDPKSYKKQLAALTEEEQAEIKEVLKTTIGSSTGFSPAQLSLAERHARAMGKGRFLSDVRPEIANSITKPGNKPKQNTELQDTYRDQVEELQHGQGNIRPEGDHHVPQKTGAGTNYFTNLLWMSRAKNNSPESKNKSVDVTNPNRAPVAMDIGLQFESESSSSSVRTKGNSQNLTTVTKGEVGPTDTTRAQWLHSLFDGAKDSTATRAKLYNAEEFERRQQEAYQAHLTEYGLDKEETEQWEAANKGVRPMPWKINKQARQDAKKLVYQ